MAEEPERPEPTRPGGHDQPDELARLRARVADLEAGQAGQPRHRVRSLCSALLIVLAAILAPLSVVSSWAADEVGDTDRYVATVAPLASDPAVQDAIANRVADAVKQNLDIGSLLQQVAPDDRPRLTAALGALGNSLDNALASFIHEKALAVVQSSAFADFWTNANRKIHDSLDKALTGKGGGAVQLTDNAVTIDLAPLVDQVKQRLVDSGITVAGKIPEIHTDYEVVSSEKIGKVRTGFRLLQLVGNWLGVLTALIAAGGVLLAVRRRRALVAVALAIAGTTLALGSGLTVFRTVYLDALPSTVSQDAAAAVYDALVRLIRATVRTVVTLGVLVALGAWLSGPGRRATQVRDLWHSGLAATRDAAARAGLRTGPIGGWTHRYRGWLNRTVVGAAGLTLALWPYPTGWVISGLALTLLAALTVIEFLADSPDPGGPVTSP